jgi:hypothetical protein
MWTGSGRPAFTAGKQNDDHNERQDEHQTDTDEYPPPHHFVSLAKDT